MANIVFETEGVDMPALDREVVRMWVVAVAKDFGKAVGTLTYIFCDDAEILRVNREFLKHDYYTDIITFDYSTRRRHVYIARHGANQCRAFRPRV